MTLAVANGAYLMTTIGIGLLISTLSETQQQAMMSTFSFFISGGAAVRLHVSYCEYAGCGTSYNLFKPLATFFGDYPGCFSERSGLCDIVAANNGVIYNWRLGIGLGRQEVQQKYSLEIIKRSD